MRQSGVLAAAGLIALEQMPGRLAEDHANARKLADALARCPGVKVESPVETNIVIADVSGSKLTAAAFSEAMKQTGVLFNPISPTKIRMVTHLDVSPDQIETVVISVRHQLT